MLGTYRRIILAAFCILTVATAPSLDVGAETEEIRTSRDIRRSLETIANAQAEAVEREKSGEYERPCREGEYNNQSDLCAQWYAARAAGEAARWSSWTVWLSIASLALSAGGLVALVVTIRQARMALSRAADANEIARDAAYLDIRPWLSVTEIVFSEVSFDDEGKCWLHAKVALQNFGRTPCTRAWIDTTVTHDWDEATHDALAGNRLRRGTHHLIDSLAPGEKRTMDIAIIETVSDFYAPDEHTGRVFAPILATHLNYFAFDERVKHISGQLWGMGRTVYKGAVQPLIEADFLTAHSIPIVRIHRTVKMT